MGVEYQYIVLGLSLVTCAIIVWCLRANILHPVHALWWGLVVVLMLLAGIFPYPPTLYLCIAVVVLLIRILLGDRERARLILQLRILNQHQARLALRVRQLEKILQPAAAEHTDEHTDTASEAERHG